MIEYKPERDNLAIDALSRCFYLTSSQSQESFFTELQLLQSQDKTYDAILKALQDTCIKNFAYSIRKGLLCWKGRLVIPNDHNLKQCLLKDFHNFLFGGWGFRAGGRGWTC